MFDDEERTKIKQIFRPFGDKTVSEEMVNNTIAYLENADFYERLENPAEIDECFRNVL